MIDISVQIDSPYKKIIATSKIIAIATSTLQACQVTQGTLTVVITSDEAVQDLNHTYRGVNAPTDVLSFEVDTSPEMDDEVDENMDVNHHFISGEELNDYLGDIIISAPTAIQQAQAAGHQSNEEIMLLTIHGTLHLLQFDHDTPKKRAQMWHKQTEILALNNLSHVKPTEEAH